MFMGNYLKSYSYYDGNEMRWVSDSNALYKSLLEKIREVFDVKEYEDGGLTEHETLELLNKFLAYKKVRRVDYGS